MHVETGVVVGCSLDLPAAAVAMVVMPELERRVNSPRLARKAKALLSEDAAPERLKRARGAEGDGQRRGAKPGEGHGTDVRAPVVEAEREREEREVSSRKLTR